MAIEKTRDRLINGYYVQCDCCGETKEVQETFQDAVADSTEDGWQRKLEDGNWSNYCQDCRD